MQELLSSAHLTKDSAGRRLLDFIRDHQQELGLDTGYLYYEYPIYQDYESSIAKPSFLLLSEKHGITLLRTVSSSDPRDVTHADENLTQIHASLVGKLIKSKTLRSGTSLNVPISAYLYSDELQHPPADLTNPVLTNASQLLANFKSKHHLTGTAIDEIRSIIEGAKALSRQTVRDIPPGRSDSKSAVLASLELEVANFDEEQRKAAITIVPGAQRIRGLAGSGKTIVLAMKAAHLHLTNPDAHILVTFNTRGLLEYTKSLISRFYRQFADDEPDWQHIHVIHSWGGKRLTGVYYEACLDSRIQPLTFKEVPAATKDKFNYACEQLLESASVKAKYDFILIDEAQDFSPSFFKLCWHLAKGKGDDKSIIWAYDELQNIYSVRTRTPRELFGTDESGSSLVDLSRSMAANNIPQYLSNDIVLHKCYRTARDVLVCAHALGFAIYSRTPVQMLENRSHWEDVGYEVIAGTFEKGSETILMRPKENSPLTITEKVSKHDLIEFYCATDFEDELKYITSQITHFLDEGLHPEDILIVPLDDRNWKRYFSMLESMLTPLGVQLNLIGTTTEGSLQVKVPNKVGVATVYQAKGNEAPAVLVVGIEALFLEHRRRSSRNKLFTALTRSKAWVRVSGIDRGARHFGEELKLALHKSPKLEFIYPDPEEVEMIQRDLPDLDPRRARLLEQLKKLGVTEADISAYFASDIDK